MSDLRDEIVKRISETKAELSRLNGLLGEISPMDQPVAVTMEDLCAEKFEWAWILGGQIGRSTIGMLIADPHVGKSTLMLQLCLAFATGSNTLGWKVETPHRVLYCFAEGARALVAERIKACAKTSGVTVPPTGFVQAPIFDDFNVKSPGFRRLIEDTRPDFCVLDALGYFGSGFDENSAVDWKKAMMIPLRELSAEFNVAFAIVHHKGKEKEDRRGWQTGRGTSAMYADVDWYWRLEAEDGDGNEMKRVLTVDKNKYGVSGQRVLLTFNKPGAFFDWRV